jgi:hypothetical protein
MFAQFRAQYPQGRIQTEMLPKIDGLHAFRAIVSEGDAIMGTATAVDSDLEIAEDRAVKRALAIAGVAFDNGFEHNYGNYAPMLASREPNVNSLPSANFTPLASLGSSHDSRPVTHTTQTIQAQPSPDYANEYRKSEYVPEDNLYYSSESVTAPLPTSQPIQSKPASPQISPEPIDLSDAISKIDVEMERLSWTKTQGRDYLVRTFDKKSRQQLTHDELLQFLSHLKSLPTPHKQSSNDDFF